MHRKVAWPSRMRLPSCMTFGLASSSFGVELLRHFLQEAFAAGTRRHCISLNRGALREVRESLYWLRLLERTRLTGHSDAERYLDALYQSQIWAVAVPVVVEGRMEAALSSLVLRSAGQRKRLLGAILPALRRTAARLAAKMQADMAETVGLP